MFKTIRRAVDKAVWSFIGKFNRTLDEYVEKSHKGFNRKAFERANKRNKQARKKIKKKTIKPGTIIIGNEKCWPDCPVCGEHSWRPIPDSCAVACECGFVLVEAPEGERILT